MIDEHRGAQMIMLRWLLLFGIADYLLQQSSGYKVTRDVIDEEVLEILRGDEITELLHDEAGRKYNR